MIKVIQLGRQLTKQEMKQINGGYAPGTCCAHSPSGYVSCGISKATAIAHANEYASETGNRAFWCCSSCPEQLS